MPFGGVFGSFQQFYGGSNVVAVEEKDAGLVVVCARQLFFGSVLFVIKYGDVYRVVVD